MDEEIIWLKFSQTERMLYNAFISNPNNDPYDVYLRKLCCHPSIADETKAKLANCKTLKDIEKIIAGKLVLFTMDNCDTCELLSKTLNLPKSLIKISEPFCI